MAISMRGSLVFLLLLSSGVFLAQDVRATSSSSSSSETESAPDAGPMGTSMDAASETAATEAQPDAENEINSEESDESRDKRNLGYGGGYAAPASTVTISVIPGAGGYPAAPAVPGKVTVVPGPETYGGNGYINGYQPYGGPSPPRYKRNYPYKPPFWYFH